MRGRALSAVLLLGWAFVSSASELVAESVHGTVLRGTTDKPFADVIQELDFAITERNFRITGRNTIGKGLRERGYKDFPEVEVIHFCSLEYAREVLLLDPGYVAMMPCRMTVHEAAGKTVVSAILLPEQHPNPEVAAFAHRMNGILREILDFVLEVAAP
jgi:uncharacterized protein (DUF302 family)